MPHVGHGVVEAGDSSGDAENDVHPPQAWRNDSTVCSHASTANAQRRQAEDDFLPLISASLPSFFPRPERDGRFLSRQAHEAFTANHSWPMPSDK